ncbi:hypothetical protein J6590_017626 [Homalodisca vitripennis]|nr:hypothetical protein J6590_017626 [Homalodisca vitripennis]
MQNCCSQWLIRAITEAHLLHQLSEDHLRLVEDVRVRRVYQTQTLELCALLYCGICEPRTRVLIRATGHRSRSACLPNTDLTMALLVLWVSANQEHVLIMSYLQEFGSGVTKHDPRTMRAAGTVVSEPRTRVNELLGQDVGSGVPNTDSRTTRCWYCGYLRTKNTGVNHELLWPQDVRVRRVYQTQTLELCALLVLWVSANQEHGC